MFTCLPGSGSPATALAKALSSLSLTIIGLYMCEIKFRKFAISQNCFMLRDENSLNNHVLGWIYKMFLFFINNKICVCVNPTPLTKKTSITDLLDFHEVFEGLGVHENDLAGVVMELGVLDRDPVWTRHQTLGKRALKQTQKL